MSQTNNLPPVQGLDFYSGYEPHDSKRRPFPGQNDSEPRVLIEKEVFKELQEHAGETVAVELCGVLVGTTCQDDSGKYLVISGSIRGKHSRNEGAQVAFTHETWDYIHSEMEAKFKGRAIVGWYHTHPGFGIFLSDMDKFIQDYFFNQPFQVALVIDPISSKDGLFAWVNGKTRSLSRCWVGNEMHKLAQGAVGSEEIREKFPIEKAYTPQTDAVAASMISNQEREDSAKAGKYYILTIALAFFVGISLSSFLFRSTLYHAALTASRAETRELLGAWASDTAAAEEFKLLHAKVAALSDNYVNMLKQSDNSPALGASFAMEIDAVRDRIGEIASASANRRSRVHSVLESIATQKVRDTEQSGQVMQKMREVMAESLLAQIMPYLSTLSVKPLDMNRLREAKLILEHIIELDPRLGPVLKEKLPWMFY